MEQKYHVLVVEDDKEIREGIEIYLRNQGYEVYEAANGAEGLKVVEREEIHLAIVDIMMPVMDGVTMLMKLRCPRWTPPAPDARAMSTRSLMMLTAPLRRHRSVKRT